jgi:hypothetical protein
VAQKLKLPTAVLVKKLPRVNDRPIGENSPNLVTLAVWYKKSLMNGNSLSDEEVPNNRSVGTNRLLTSLEGLGFHKRRTPRDSQVRIPQS